MKVRSGRDDRTTRSPRSRRRGALKTATVLGASLVCATALTACAPSSEGTTINLYYAPEDNLQKVVDNCNQKAQGQYNIVYHKLPRDADGQREQMVRRLAAGDSAMDVLGLDITWTPEFAGAGWVHEWTGQHKEEAERGTLEGPLSSARYEGKLYAAPKNTNVELLWYRGDLVSQPPKTWDEMIQQAQQLKAQGKPANILMAGKQYEGFVAEFNTLVRSSNGKIVSDDGKRAVVDEGVVRALETLKKLSDSGVTSPSMSNAEQDDIRSEFEKDGGAFQVNWPFVYASMKEDAPHMQDKMKWAPYPSTDPNVPSKVTLGGYNLAVSKYSKNPEASFAAAKCIRNPENQKFSAIQDGLPPTIESVYSEPGMAEEYPMRDLILSELKDSSIRPNTPAYQNVSTVLSHMLSPSSKIDPPRTAEEMRKEVQNALDSKGVMP